MKHAATLALCLVVSTPADAGKLKWLTDAADAAKGGGVTRNLPDEPWLRQTDGTYLDLAVIPDGDGTKLMGKADDGSLVELTKEQLEEVMGLVTDGALSLPTDEEVAATDKPESDAPGWLVFVIGAGILAFVAWQVWGFVKGVASAGRRAKGWFSKS